MMHDWWYGWGWGGGMFFGPLFMIAGPVLGLPPASTALWG
jgi:hypothetical protein